MKKFLAKLVLFTLVSITILSSTTFAQDPLDELQDLQDEVMRENPDDFDDTDRAIAGEERDLRNLGNALGDVEDCVKSEEIQGEGSSERIVPGPDANYIVTIIEEPLGPVTTDNSDEDFKVRACYRLTFSFSFDKKQEILSKLAESCSSRAEGLSTGAIADKYTVRYTCKEVEVFLSKGGKSLIEGYISTIYRWAAGIVGVIAVVVIVISGIQISVSGGDSAALDAAKTRIIQSIAGIVVLLLSGIILYTINPTFFVR